MRGIIPVNFLIMGNTLNMQGDNIMKTYDLKGSIINRDVRKPANMDKVPTLKDQNLRKSKKVRFNKKQVGFL
jgi:hypothetical protein